MKNQKWINSLVFVVGLILGPFALLAFKQVDSAVVWWDISYVFLGCLAGAALVICIQTLWNEAKYGELVLDFVLLISLSILGIGITASATDLMINELGASSMLSLAAGTGLSLGVLVSRLFLNAKYADAV